MLTMSFEYQYDLFEEYDELSAVKSSIESLKKTQENVRRGIFARHNDLSKLYLVLKKDYELLEKRMLFLEKNLIKK
jgi:hypothetical protein